MTLKILLLDDHALFRAGLRLLLQTLERGAAIFEAGSIAEALTLAAQQPGIQLCLLDLNLRNEDGFQILGQIKQVAPEITLVVVSSCEESATIRACLDAGAMSFIPKSATPEVFTKALKHVLAGEVYLPTQILDADAEQAPVSLSPRQREVLAGLCRGLSTKAIARELDLSEYTVKDYIAAVFQILAVHNRTEAVIKAGQMRLLPEQN